MHVIAAAVRFATVAGPRVNSVVNAASQLSTPLSPGGTFTVQGSGFGSDATITLDGSPVTVLSRTASALTASVPVAFQDRIGRAVSVQVQSGGAPSNAVLMPMADTAPGIFSGWILNPDGTRNSPSNHTAEGLIITIYATGVGTASPAVPAVFIDGFYASGVDDSFGPVDGLPGNVYRVRVFVPHPADWVDRNPNLAGFKIPSQVAVRLEVRGHASQPGVQLSVK
jgi:hypothetical protein